MPKARPPYPAVFRQQMVELVRSGRTPEDLTREFEPSAQATFPPRNENTTGPGRRTGMRGGQSGSSGTPRSSTRADMANEDAVVRKTAG